MSNERLTREALAKLTRKELQVLFNKLSAKQKPGPLDIAYAYRLSEALIVKNSAFEKEPNDEDS